MPPSTITVRSHAVNGLHTAVMPAENPKDRCLGFRPGTGYCSAMIRSNSTIGLIGTSSLRVTVTVWMVAVQGNGAR